MGEKEPFTKVMRKATRGIHNVSDALINAKLGFAVSDNQVWAEGLLLFYEVFKQLEGAMDRLKGTGALIEEIDIPGMRRTKAFEEDLIFYLGENWKANYVPNPSVVKYIEHLSNLERNQPTRLIAYVYHLYMGLFAGGQILKKKRTVILRLSFSSRDPTEGLAVVNMGGKMFQVKKQMAEAMNRICEPLEEKIKHELIEESKRVFTMNNEMVHTIKGTNQVLFKKLLKAASVIVVLVSIYYYYRKS